MESENFQGDFDSQGTQESQSENTSEASETQGTETEQARGQSKGPALTPDEAHKAYMRHEDYTRKTQEIAKEREEIKRYKEEQRQDETYIRHLRYDLDKLRENPALVSEFRKIYPQKYHHLVEGLEAPKQSAEAPAKDQDQTQTQEFKNLPPEIQKYVKSLLSEELKPFKSMQEKFETQEHEKSKQFIDAQFDSNSKKYPHADEALVIERCTRFQAQNGRLTAQDIEKIFKSEHDRMDAWGKKYQGTRTQEILQKQKQASDMGGGGGVPGKGPKKYKNLTDHVNDYLANS